MTLPLDLLCMQPFSLFWEYKLYANREITETTHLLSRLRRSSLLSWILLLAAKSILADASFRIVVWIKFTRLRKDNQVIQISVVVLCSV